MKNVHGFFENGIAPDSLIDFPRSNEFMPILTAQILDKSFRWGFQHASGVDVIRAEFRQRHYDRASADQMIL